MKVAKLTVFGQEYEVINADIMYYRMLNHKTGRCSPVPAGGLISLSVYASRNDNVLAWWITHAEEGELCTLTEGKLTFHEDSLDNPMLFQYHFNDAALVSYTEEFNCEGEQPMTISLVISPAIQKFRWQTFVKHWQESWVPPSDKMPYVAGEEKNTPKVASYTYLDNTGKTIDKVTEGDLTIRIKTKGMVGEKITIDLSDSKYDFLYKGELIENDILKDIAVTASSIEVPLEVIKQKTT